MALATANEVAELALRQLGVIAAGEAMSADAARDTVTAFNRLLAELDREGYPLGFTADTVPEWAQMPLAQMLMFEVSLEYGLTPVRQQWWEARARLRRHVFPDDRPAFDDFDEDGTIEDGEAEAAKRSLQY